MKTAATARVFFESPPPSLAVMKKVFGPLPPRTKKVLDSQGLRHHVLRILRKDGISQRQLADKIGCSQAYLSDFLKGRREPGEGIYSGLGFKRFVIYTKD